MAGEKLRRLAVVEKSWRKFTFLRLHSTPKPMAKCEPCERSYDNMVKMLEDLNRDLEKLLEDMEKLSDYVFQFIKEYCIIGNVNALKKTLEEKLQ